MSGTRSISLEIYGLRGGRWNIHANYSIHQRIQCLEDAKELDAKGRFEAVCVVRETYSEADNTARQAVIYHSPKLPSPPPVAIVTEGAAGGGSPKPAAAQQRATAEAEGDWRKKDEDKKKQKQTAPKEGSVKGAPEKEASEKGAGEQQAKPVKTSSPDGPTLADVLPRLIAVASISLMGALVIAYIAYVLIQFLPTLEIVLSKTASQSIIISVFLISFVFIFIPLLKRYVPVIQSAANRRTQLATAAPAPAPVIGMVPAADTDPPPAGGQFDDVPDLPPVVPKIPDSVPGIPRSVPGIPRSVSGIQESVSADVASEEEADDETEEAEDESEEKKADTGTRLKKSAPKAKKADVSGEMLKFIRDSLEPLAKAGFPLNAFNRFGLTLFFAGAGEFLSTRNKVSGKEMSDILCAHVQILGHTSEMASGFCANIEEYLVNAKYFQMYEKGRTALAAHVQNPDAELQIAEAMEEWNKPAPVTSKSEKEFVAVLFTDIVGSTAMTQERGDDAAQLVVREHNTIVREALALHGGKEIKHTGDGIMATFSQISNAVEGAVAMQQACQRANGTNPDLELGLCIGVNAGEPIHEDGDIFGTPVQMAARVLSKAEVDEIAVSNLVREMCTGKSFKFSKKGDYELKGFSEPVPIYLVDWESGLNGPDSDKK